VEWRQADRYCSSNSPGDMKLNRGCRSCTGCLYTGYCKTEDPSYHDKVQPSHYDKAEQPTPTPTPPDVNVLVYFVSLLGLYTPFSNCSDAKFRITFILTTAKKFGVSILGAAEILNWDPVYSVSS